MDNKSPDVLPSLKLPQNEVQPQSSEAPIRGGEVVDARQMEQAGHSPATAPAQQQGAFNSPIVPAQPPRTTNAPTSDPQAPQIAEDADLIEKEWVKRAKAIVEETRHDPYVQNQKMSQFKADYVKKRYNKDIKVDNE